MKWKEERKKRRKEGRKRVRKEVDGRKLKEGGK